MDHPHPLIPLRFLALSKIKKCPEETILALFKIKKCPEETIRFVEFSDI